jgi:hypothetical protein
MILNTFLPLLFSLSNIVEVCSKCSLFKVFLVMKKFSSIVSTLQILKNYLPVGSQSL